ncbi:MAG: aminotransferase class V-fold PLP-dependent enzyme [Ignavibacteriales bacterium]|nr:aminotransferase class V-fold PLP-dependent enzyme [Ignavibacteriales bacterium]
METLEQYFALFREQTIGWDQLIKTPYGEQRLVYADWTASGRLYSPIEYRLIEEIGPFVGNTHSESNLTGMLMTQAYHAASHIIKQHVNAAKDDALLNIGFGMTAGINKLQRILGLKAPEQLRKYLSVPDELRPVVFLTHMEHHSNQTTWYETIADVEVIPPTVEGLVDLTAFALLLEKHKNRKIKYGSFTSCSNVTGIQTPYHAMAKLMHTHGGVCFIDFAASAPYVPMDMHPEDPEERLDAIMFSPHKFLGGPGSAGVLIFSSSLYTLRAPDQPGGGTVLWTNPWGQYAYIPDIELREDGGTPGFLQTIRAALAIQLKETMGTENMRRREEELVAKAFAGLRTIPNLVILADSHEHRLGMISFYIENLHYNLVVRLLNDRFGIQMRGGCSCAGTYGHYLLHVDPSISKQITDKIDGGDLSAKPGWVRLSVHPTMTDTELEFIVHALREIRLHAEEWKDDYTYNNHTNEFLHQSDLGKLNPLVDKWFEK